MAKDKYDPGFLKAELAKLGYKFYYFPKTDSTMQIVEEFARKGRQALAVVLTDHQARGIGRYGRKWLDKPNYSIMFSVLFRIKESSIASFADLSAMMICQTLRRVTGDTSIKIKYPNDIIANDKKLGGILVKNIYNRNLRYLGTNLGVGLNIHYTSSMLKKFKTDYDATSLDICTSSFNKRQELLIEILRDLKYLGIETEVVEVNPKTAEMFDKKWSEISGMMGRKIAVLKNDQVIEEGLVTNTRIGKGIELLTLGGQKWFSLFDTDMKARIVNQS